MRRRRPALRRSVGLLIFTVAAAVPAHAQFPASTAPPNAPPAPLPPVRKVVEDDGVSAYAVTDLGTLPDSAVASPVPPGTPPAWVHWQPDSVGGLNKRGDVALNFSRTAGGKRAGVYHADTKTITVLPLPEGASNAETYAVGLADDGRVLGRTDGRERGSGQFHPILWSGTTVIELLDQKDDTGRPADSDLVTALALSHDGNYAAGDVFLNGVGATIALWHGGTLSHTEALNQGMAQSWGVTNTGDVVGNAPPATDEAHPLTSRNAFLWSNGSLTNLGTAIPGVNSGARAVNAGGTVVGWSDTQDVMAVHRSDVHAVSWKDGRLTDLGTLGGSSSTAADVNDAGQIVGFATSGPGDQGQSFLWENGKMRPLTSLIPSGTGWTLGDAQINYGGEGFLFINAQGQIAGVGRRDAVQKAFLLTPRSLLPKK